ncbi:hypothetical protein VCR31J2_1310625 [Vibrio coralliirubri]|uniref:Uncharacterized protein n=1 Tax=Vibrio coralliirubri TaxID=1516159 RepID=A0AA86WZT3_9VIBR|nr:hypothetical protein VCR31J2_1310625 [Vibrio coralliirubri]
MKDTLWTFPATSLKQRISVKRTIEPSFSTKRLNQNPLNGLMLIRTNWRLYNFKSRLLNFKPNL